MEVRDLNTDYDYIKKVNNRERRKYAHLLTTDDTLLTRGQRLKKYRILSGHTINTLSQLGGICPSHLGEVENGNSFFSFSRALIFAKILGIEPTLIALTEEDKQREKFAGLLNSEDYTLTIGERIRKYRILNNYLPTEFAEQFNITRTHLCNIEKNKCYASNKLLHLFAAKFNIDIALLCEPKSTNNDLQIEKLHKMYARLLQMNDNLLSPGQLIRKNRILKGFTTSDLSSEIGVSVSLVNKVENDKCNISLEFAEKISVVLNLDKCRLYDKEKGDEREKKSRKKINEDIYTLKDELLSIGQRIRKYRLIKDYSLCRLADEVGVKEPYLVVVEKGICFLSYDKTKKAATILGIDVALITPTIEDKKKQKVALALHKKKQSMRASNREKSIQKLLLADESLLSIGEIIRKYRILKGYTLKELAKKIGITGNYLGQFERNKLRLSSKSILKIADVLEIDHSLIMMNEEEQQKIDFSELIKTDDSKLSIGERIKKYRIINNYTIASFAKLCDVTKPHLTEIERDNANASLKLTKKMAKVLRIDYTLIYISEEEAQKRKACYILKIKNNKIEKNSKLLNADDITLTIGERIKKYRIKSGYTIKEISALVNIKFSTFNSYENNRSKPSKRASCKIAEVFNINPTLFYEDSIIGNV